MSLKKQYLKNKTVCKVTFNLSKEESGGAETVNLVGEFNNWDAQATPLNKFKNGNFTIMLELAPGKEYQFRYFLNGEKWINDPQADKYVPVPGFDAENSVVIV